MNKHSIQLGNENSNNANDNETETERINRKINKSGKSSKNNIITTQVVTSEDFVKYLENVRKKIMSQKVEKIENSEAN